MYESSSYSPLFSTLDIIRCFNFSDSNVQWYLIVILNICLKAVDVEHILLSFSEFLKSSFMKYAYKYFLISYPWGQNVLYIFWFHFFFDHWLVWSVLFNIHIYVNLPNFFHWLLISFHCGQGIYFVLFYSFKMCILLPSICSILEKCSMYACKECILLLYSATVGWCVP